MQGSLNTRVLFVQAWKFGVVLFTGLPAQCWNTTQPLQDPGPLFCRNNITASSLSPCLLTAPWWLTHQSLSKTWELWEFLHINTLHCPSLSIQQPIAQPKASVGNFRFYAKEKKSTKFKRTSWLWLLLPRQENDPHVRVSSHSASLQYVSLPSKDCFSDPRKKGLEKAELDLSGKKINEVISLRSRNPIPYYFPFATPSIGSPSARIADLCKPFKLSLLGLLSIKQGFKNALSLPNGAGAVRGGHCNCTWRHEARQKLKASPWSPSSTAHINHISAFWCNKHLLAWLLRMEKWEAGQVSTIPKSSVYLQTNHCNWETWMAGECEGAYG